MQKIKRSARIYGWEYTNYVYFSGCIVTRLEVWTLDSAIHAMLLGHEIIARRCSNKERSRKMPTMGLVTATSSAHVPKGARSNAALVVHH